MVTNWKDLSEEDRAPIESLTDFFCGLHSFVQLAELAGASVLEVEETNLSERETTSPPFVLKKSCESGTVRLIKTASKAFSRTGDAKSGCYGEFKLFMKPHLTKCGMTSVPLCPFRGNRFNILFFNVAHVFFIHRHMQQFLDQQPNLNNLLKAVKHDLNITLHIAGCKALGLLNKFVTRPLWKLIEDKELHILDMSKYMQQLLTYLNKANENMDEFMTGKIIPFDDEAFVHKDEVYKCLIESSEYDNDVQMVLSVVIPAMTMLLKKHYAELLPGGSQSNATKEMYEAAKSVDKHNKYAECVLAYVDQLLRSRPNSKHLSKEAIAMFCLNKTGDWLNQKPTDEKNRLIDEARKDARIIQQKYKLRRQEIVQKRNCLLQEKLQKEEARRHKQMENKEMMTADIVYYGLWQSAEQVKVSIGQIKSKTEKMDGLKAQLRFRQHILQQEADAKLYRHSEKDGDGRRNLTVEEMTSNLLSLIHHSTRQPGPSHTPFLIGKRVRHLFGEGEARQPNEGKIISTVPGYPIWFNIKYSNDEAIYTLLEDMEQGDLEIIV